MKEKKKKKTLRSKLPTWSGQHVITRANPMPELRNENVLVANELLLESQDGGGSGHEIVLASGGDLLRGS